jgi:hypothetical protein
MAQRKPSQGGGNLEEGDDLRMTVLRGTYRVIRCLPEVVVSVGRGVRRVSSCVVAADIAAGMEQWLGWLSMSWKSSTWERIARTCNLLTSTQLTASKDLVKAPMSTGCQRHSWSFKAKLADLSTEIFRRTQQLRARNNLVTVSEAALRHPSAVSLARCSACLVPTYPLRPLEAL